MWLSITLLMGLWMTTGTLSENKEGYCASETDSCLKNIIRCSEFRIPLSEAKLHMIKLYTNAKDLKNICE
ncbi:hypothetical protein TNIN_171721 [Trichonephila inaurata madagascariensis]|uniref:Uncharacterized protein n=1 Tax=Trichonephila inaurata madagascariensis TaxID=2747483 RepID=A0A8X7C5T7_9ARAC|nr:hypothetical protein TNIN_171721 [Trichonephila inaurata madagascariensis]